MFDFYIVCLHFFFLIFDISMLFCFRNLIKKQGR